MRNVLSFVREEKLFSAVIAIMVLSVVLVIAMIPASIEQHRRWVSGCEERGGRVASHTDTSSVVVVGANGKPSVGTTSSTTYYCLSADGRILDLK